MSATSSGYTGKKAKMACCALISGEYARSVAKSRKGQYGGLLSADRQGWKGGKLPSKRRMYHLLRLVTKAALWGAISRLASWLMGKILS